MAPIVQRFIKLWQEEKLKKLKKHMANDEARKEKEFANQEAAKSEVMWVEETH